MVCDITIKVNCVPKIVEVAYTKNNFKSFNAFISGYVLKMLL